MGDVEKLIAWRKSQVGYTCENKDNKYARDIDNNHPEWYNGKKNKFDWCTVFFDDGFIQCFGEEKARKMLNRPKKSLGAGVRYSREYLKSIGRVGNEPRIGAAIYFGSLPYPRHIGFVYDVDSKYVYTIEGNTTYKGKNGVDYRKYSRSCSDILDYGYPIYDVDPTPTPEPDPQELDGFKVGHAYKIVCKSPLMIRKEPTTSADTVGQLKYGSKIICEHLRRDDSGNTWLEFDLGWSCGLYNGNRYMEETTLEGWVKLDKRWYYYVDGKKVTGLQDIDGAKYCFDENGIMLTGWVTFGSVKYYCNSNGKVALNWRKVGDKWYYFGTDGIMQKSKWIADDGKYYFVDENGQMVTGWNVINGKKYWCDAHGARATGWKKIKKLWYYFSNNGVMQTGWITDDDVQYYLYPDGHMAATQWITGLWLDKHGAQSYPYKGSWQTAPNGAKQYVDESGWMAINCKQTIDGKVYTFDTNGYVVKPETE